MQTERTLWFPLEEKDFPDMMEMAREPDTFKYIRKFQVMTEEEYRRFLYTKLEQIRRGQGYHWAVRLKTDKSFIGAVNLNPIGNSSLLQIGCQLKRACWHQGFATELIKKVVTFAFDEAGLTEVYGVFEKENIVSRKLLDRLGFQWQETRTDTATGVETEIHKTSATALPPPSPSSRPR
jgi:ribosomal-protein-alanine N-acetyltransferase